MALEGYKGVVVGALSACAGVALYLEVKRRSSPIERGTPLPKLMATKEELTRMLDVIEHEVLPKTHVTVTAGNKLFGAAILDKTGKTVIAESNHEVQCPIWHGEVYAIHEWAKIKAKPKAAESTFIATHEPCCLCISAIVWAGFKNCYFLYPYETTRDQGIPHDLKIMHELWNVERYQTQNQFLAAAGILDLIGALPDSADKKELLDTVKRITVNYDKLSHKYHSEKGGKLESNDVAFN